MEAGAPVEGARRRQSQRLLRLCGVWRVCAYPVDLALGPGGAKPVLVAIPPSQVDLSSCEGSLRLLQRPQARAKGAITRSPISGIQ